MTGARPTDTAPPASTAAPRPAASPGPSNASSAQSAAQRLERAREHCFMAGVGDVGMQLCEANVPYGLAKIHEAQAQLGLAPDATFVGAPDATVTRNHARWRQGFGYGGIYQWSGDFAVLDIKPNACGMIVGALPRLPALEEVRERLHALSREGLTLDGVPLDNDLTESNHFIDVLEVSERLHGDDEPLPEAVERARYFYIMHSSGHEHRGVTARGPGLYWDESQALLALARTIETPWGTLRVLEGEAAHAWYAFYQRVQDFNHRRRAALGQFLFGETEALINATHQGLVRGVNQANIGCYTFEAGPGADAGPLFPLTLSPTLPAFLVRGRPSVREERWDELGWSDRIERHGLAARVRDANLLPHGGGYNYPHLRGVARVIEDGPDARRFELTPADPAAQPMVVETPRELRYTYRGMEVKERMEALDLGRAVLALDLRYIVTA
jgi:hypothetical protein